MKWKKNLNNEKEREEYNSYKNQLSTLLKTARKNNCMQRIQPETLQDNKHSNLSGRRKNLSHVKVVENEQFDLNTDIQEIANEFNKHYTTMGDKITQKIKPVLTTSPRETKSHLANKRNIGTKKIKLLANQIAKPIATLINKIIDDKVGPTAFKFSVTVPICKKDDLNKVVNYRPISLISILAKIMEKVFT